MKVLLFLVVVAFVSCADTASDEDSSSSSEENVRSYSKTKENGDSQSEEDSSSSASDSFECQISYKYTIWIGDNVDEVHSVNMQSECGIVFLDVMRQASKKKEQFAFKQSTHPQFGTYVTQIDGVPNDDIANTYWMMYDLTTGPDVDSAPDDKYLCSIGVSSLEVLNGHSYLFWYRTVTEDEDYN